MGRSILYTYRRAREMLEYTSCLFATVVIHAFYARLFVYHHLFLAVMMLSILNHSTHDPLIGKVDTIIAHLAYIWILMEAPFVIAKRAFWIFLFPICVGCLWITELKALSNQDELHAALHCVSVLGVHAYMYVLYG